MLVANISEREAKNLEKKDNIVCVEKCVDVSASGNEDSSQLDLVNSMEKEWNLKMINADSTSDSYVANKVKVAILDSGVDYTDKLNVVERKNFVQELENVEIYSAKILDADNKAPMSRVIEGIYWAIEKKVNIISISFGTNNYSEALHIAKKVADNILTNYLNGEAGSVKDFVLSDEYYDGTFRIKNLYKYANEIENLDSTSTETLMSITK